MLLEEFEKLFEGRANTFRSDVIKELNRFRFKLEAKGKKNATDAFYQPTTRAGYTRDYPLTGRLRSSIVDYADDLEFGTDTIKPFFFLGRTIQEVEDELPKDLLDMLELTLSPRGS